MKKVVLSLVFGLFIFASCSNQYHVNKFYDKYEGSENSISFKAPLFLASLMFENQSELQAFRQKVKSIKLLSISDLNEIKNAQVRSEINSALHRDKFENWFSLNKKGKLVNVSAQNRGKSVKNVVVAIQGKADLFFINAKTNLTEDELTGFILKVLEKDEK